MQRHRYDRANFSAASRPWNKGGGGGNQTRKYVGGHFFRPFGPQFGLTERGSWAPGPLPWIRAEFAWLKRLKRWLCSHLVSRHSTQVRCSRKVQGDIWVWTHRFFVSKPDKNSGAVRVQGRDHIYNHNSTIFSWHWCQLNCMHAYIVSFDRSTYLFTDSPFFFLAQNGAIASTIYEQYQI